jgi:hypothetical protein
MAIAGWYRDPSGQGDARYWNGQQWTDSVSLGGQTRSAPIDPAQATVPPAPGTEYTTPPPRPAAGQNVTVSSGGGGVSVGAVLAGVAALIAAVALVVALTRDGDSTDEPAEDTPATEAPPETEAPAEDEAPSEE